MSQVGNASRGATTVTPAPTLSANKSRHRSDGNYAKRYGRTSFENPKARHAQLSKPPQEPLKQVDSNAAAVQRSADPPMQYLASPQVTELPKWSLPSRGDYHGVETDASPLSTPSQSHVDKHRGSCDDVDSAWQQDLVSQKVVWRTTSSTDHLQLHVDPSLLRSALPDDREGSSAELLKHSASGKENASFATTPAPRHTRIEAVSATAPQATPKTASSAETKQRPVSVMSRSVTSGANTTSTGFRRIPSGYAHQRSAPLSDTSAAPRPQLVSATSTSGTGRCGNVVIANSASKGLVRAKARTVPVAKRKQQQPAPPPPPQPLPNVAAEAPENRRALAPTASTSVRTCTPDVDVALRYELVQMRSVLDYVAEVTTALSERRRCAAPPQSTKGFRASVVPCRRLALANASLEELDRGDDDSLDPIPHGRNNDGSVALLPAVHMAASRLLSAFTKLEYVQVSKDVDMLLFERDAVEHSAELLRLVDGVERQLSLNESAHVREGLAERRYVFRAVHRLVRFIVRMMHEMVVLRDLTQRHDLDQVQEVWDSFRTSVEAESRAAPELSDSSFPDRADDAATPVSRSPPRQRPVPPITMMLASPFFSWLVERWLPAMREWRKLVLDAHRAASKGDLEGAIRRSRQEALRIDGLREILRPGETMSELHQEQVEKPLKEIGKVVASKRAAMGELRKVLESDEATNGTPSAVQLSTAVKAAQAFITMRSAPESVKGTSAATVTEDTEDAALVKRAEELLARLQVADALHCAINNTLQQPALEMVAALEYITRANRLLLLWKLAHDVRAAQTARDVGLAALDSYRQRQRCGPVSETTSLFNTLHGDNVVGDCLSATRTKVGTTSTALAPWIGDAFPPSFNVHDLCIAHSSGGSWSKDLTKVYVKLCEVFSAQYTQHQARRQLELALVAPAVGGHGARVAGGFAPSPQVTPCRPTRDAASPADTLRLSDDGSNTHVPRLLASLGGTTTICHSEDTSPCTQNTPSGQNAMELRRCLQQAEESGVSGPLVEEARAQLRRLDTLRLKIHFDAQTRVLPVSDAAQMDFRVVYQQIHDFCQVQQEQQQQQQHQQPSTGAERRLRIRYEDTEGDFISLLDQQDWDMMLSELAPHGCDKVKIELFCDYPTMPGVVSNSVFGDDGDAVQHTGDDSEPASSNLHSGSAPALPAGAIGSTTATPLTTQEKRTNVFKRLASIPKVPASSTTASGQRRPRPHSHSLGVASPQRALIPPRTRGTGAVRSVSPQKSCGARRVAVSGDAACRKDSLLSASASGSDLKTVALTAENLRRNLPTPPASSSPVGVEAATQEEVQRLGDGASGVTVGDVASSAAGAAHVQAAASIRVKASTPEADNSVKNNYADVDGEQEGGVVHLNLNKARCWETASDDELQLLEMQTCASMSTVRPERSAARPESMERMRIRPTELLQKVGAARNTFTATYCSGKVESVNRCGGGGGGGASVEVAMDVGEGSEVKTQRTADLRARVPRRWSCDTFSLDEVETVCSDRSRIPQKAVEPKGPLSLPPRPITVVSCGGGGGGDGIHTPQRVRRGARGTPIRSRPNGSDDVRDGDNEEVSHTPDELLAEVERMREANTRAMAHRKSAWH
ncbi:hypothetical protein JKF63_05123 [Porcisia hertigi]|uniref:PB1 domain-containing protein n=1 Tax=Porcisia hertigi TaxID=2761500 RepID=A0A836IHR5_9TRYP|nr:hypothetical protein JKF63_05123 [Porcisia hertigi]